MPSAGQQELKLAWVRGAGPPVFGTGQAIPVVATASLVLLLDCGTLQGGLSRVTACEGSEKNLLLGLLMTEGLSVRLKVHPLSSSTPRCLLQQEPQSPTPAPCTGGRQPATRGG